MSDQNEMKPSDFVKLGKPCCSCFMKSELEVLSLEYAAALAALGDNWDLRPSPKETYDAINGDCKSYLRVMAKGMGNPAVWDVVTRKLRSEEGAREVWSMSLRQSGQRTISAGGEA